MGTNWLHCRDFEQIFKLTQSLQSSERFGFKLQMQTLEFCKFNLPIHIHWRPVGNTIGNRRLVMHIAGFQKNLKLFNPTELFKGLHKPNPLTSPKFRNDSFEAALRWRQFGGGSSVATSSESAMPSETKISEGNAANWSNRKMLT